MAVTLASLASFMGITSADARYTQLQGVLDAAVEYVEGRCGPQDTTTALLVRPVGSRLVLPVRRLTSVDAITDPDGGAVTVADCDVNLAAGVVALPSVPLVKGAYTVTVSTSGSASVDEATLIIAKHLWESRRGRQGPRDGAFAQPEDAVPQGFAIPRRAEQLLAPMETPGFA